MDPPLSQAVRPRLLYGAVFVWLSVTGGRFFAPFIEKEGPLTVIQIGVLLAVQQWVGLVANPFAGHVADAFERQHPNARVRILTTGAFFGTLAFLLLGSRRVFPAIRFLSSWEWYFALRIMYAMAVSFIMPVLDGLCIQHIQSEDRIHDYGKERLWGAVTWAIANFFLGPAYDLSGGFVISYPLSILACGGVFISSLIYIRSHDQSVYGRIEKAARDLESHPAPTLEMTDSAVDDRKEKDKATTQKQPKDDISEYTTLQLCHQLLWDASLSVPYFGALFIVAIILLAFGQVIVESLIFLYFVDDLGSSFTMMGLTVVLTVVFEIPVFSMADRLLEQFQSTKLLLLAMACYIVRVLGYSFIPHGHIAYALLLEPLHGITYACSQTAIVDYVARAMPLGKESSGQGLIYMFRGCGAILGLLIGGWVQGTLGARVLYRLAAAVVALGAFALLVANGYIKDERKDETENGDIAENDDAILEMTSMINT